MKNPDYMVQNSQHLRNNMTKEELHLWLDFLKKLPFSVRRQKVIGRYILDFYIPGARIAIEIDGRQHGRSENREADTQRDAFLESKGIKVLRYSNFQVNDNFPSVCHDIQKYCNQRTNTIKEGTPR